MSCGTLVPARSFQLLLTRLLRSLAALSNAIQLGFKMLSAGPQPQKACSLVWALPISLAATFGIDLSFFSSGYLDVSVPRVPSYTLWIHVYVPGRLPGGFPHSDIKGSMPACGSPLLFAACHVLLRRLVPWHPPCALVRLILLRMTSSVIVDPETNYNLLPSGSIATGLLRLSLVFSTSNVRLSRCVPVFAGPDSRSSWYDCQVFQLSGQGSFQSLENDTELRQQFLL